VRGLATGSDQVIRVDAAWFAVRANRMKVLVHDGFGMWLCARRLYEGHFIRAGLTLNQGIALTPEQLQAMVVGLPWERLDERTKIRVSHRSANVSPRPIV
jgi:IS66 Orf2 like protein